MESRLEQSLLLRMLIVGLLWLFLLIPAMMVESLIAERQHRRDGVVQDLESKWGQRQMVSGPVIVVPVSEVVRTREGKEHRSVSLLHLVPTVLEIDAGIAPELRRRGMYQGILYSSKIRLSGSFEVPAALPGQDAGRRIEWGEAAMVVGIADQKGIADRILMHWNGSQVSASSGNGGSESIPGGVQAAIPVDPRRTQQEFSIELHLNGGEELQVVPTGRTTTVRMTSPWSSPSFVGEFLPDRREVGPGGFNAEWRLTELRRNIAAFWSGKGPELRASAFGVKLLLPIDEYQQITRTAKYALLFIGLMIAAFFVAEVLSGRAVHPVQYGFVALGLLLFYVLLISLSEYMSFAAAYGISSAAVVLLVGAYARTLFRSTRHALASAGGLFVLYAFLYVVVQAEDYALLLGSAGLFAVLASVMYATRNVDWFRLRPPARAL